MYHTCTHILLSEFVKKGTGSHASVYLPNARTTSYTGNCWLLCCMDQKGRLHQKEPFLLLREHSTLQMLLDRWTGGQFCEYLEILLTRSWKTLKRSENQDILIWGINQAWTHSPNIKNKLTEMKSTHNWVKMFITHKRQREKGENYSTKKTESSLGKRLLRKQISDNICSCPLLNSREHLPSETKINCRI